jgi:hypothetical protein
MRELPRLTHPALTRAHLEAVLIARVLLDPALADDVELDRLSPAALKLVFAAVGNAELAGGAGGLLAVAEPSGDPAADAFVVRLADRVEALTLLDLTLFSRALLLALVHTLPPLHADRAELRRRYDAYIAGRDFGAEIIRRRAERRSA